MMSGWSGRESVAAGAALLLTMLLGLVLLSCFCGCCRNTGTYAVVGDLDAPVDISDGSDTVNIRALFSLTGAKVWSARDSKVTMTYTNIYTNVYLGIVDTKGVQGFRVDVEPLAVDGETAE